MAEVLWNDPRKLRPIYDAIDARNYKQALKLTSSLLEKKPTACILKVPVAQRAPRSARSEYTSRGQVLKALSLERTGRIEEASVLCDQVSSAEPAR